MYVAGRFYTESSCNKCAQEFTVTKAATWTLAYVLFWITLMLMVTNN